MTSCDAELAFLDELAEAAGIPVEEKKEEADCKGNEQQGAPYQPQPLHPREYPLIGLYQAQSR